MGMDISGKGNKDAYFRANVWSWRPLHALCEGVLGKRLEDWGYNDGAGLATQAECNELAEKIEAYLKQFPKEEIALESNLRVDEEGKFLLPGSTEGKSPYTTDREHAQEFVEFLRSCDGFEIW